MELPEELKRDGADGQEYDYCEEQKVIEKLRKMKLKMLEENRTMLSAIKTHPAFSSKIMNAESVAKNLNQLDLDFEEEVQKTKIKIELDNLKKEKALRKGDILQKIEMLEKQKAILQIECSANKKNLQSLQSRNNMMKKKIKNLILKCNSGLVTGVKI